MNKISLFFICGLLALCSIMHGEIKDNDQTGSVSRETEQERLLYVLMAKYGELKKSQNGEFVLTIPKNRIENFLGFTDRPERRVNRRVSGNQFQKNWKKGISNSYEEDPPNAALIIDGDLQTVVLKSFKTTSKEMVFMVDRDGHESIFEKKGPVILFIDSSTNKELGEYLNCLGLGECA